MAACRMSEENSQHQSVMLNETIQHLAINPNGIYVDATFGRGGHSKIILEHLNPQGRLFAFDKDPEAIQFAKIHFGDDKRFSIHHGSFTDLKSFLTSENVYGAVDGILFDLGVSSPQLDTPERGFSFMREGDLDMRMDISSGVDAKTWLATVKEEELANILWQFGEERFSRRIAKAIVQARTENPITTTHELAEIVKRAMPIKEKHKHPATRTFQAIRIYINNELDDLKIALEQSVDALKIGGRLVVISFHSLEDRVVKHFIQDQERGKQLPKKLPVKEVSLQQRLKKIGAAVKPSSLEIAMNPRARSAVLRIAEKMS